MKAYVDPKKCISCGLCIGMCSSVFDFNDDGISEVIGEITDDNEEEVMAAAESCPTNAIIVQ